MPVILADVDFTIPCVMIAAALVLIPLIVLDLVRFAVKRLFPAPGPGRCKRCGYDLAGLEAGANGVTCPECGQRAAP
jgi:tRNA(Ile2) C34 agmatinyltransferase TiaS